MTNETVKRPTDPARALLLFREFVLVNAIQWKMGASNPNHPMWGLVSEALGDANEEKHTDEEWPFIWAEH